MKNAANASSDWSTVKNNFERKAFGVKPKDKRERVQFRFDLDFTKEGELQIASWLNWLKKRRQYKTTLIEGFQLIVDLKNNSTARLEEMFPALISRLVESRHNARIDALTNELIEVKAQLAATSKPTPPSSGDDELKRRVEYLEQLMLSQQSPNTVKMAGQGAPVRTPRPSIAPKPAYVEPSPVVEADTSTAFLDAF